MLFINLKEKCGISHFFRKDWLNRPISVQISAFMFRIDSSSPYWDNTQFIEGVRSGYASTIDIEDFRIILFNGNIEGAEGSQDIITPANLAFEERTININTEFGFWGVILKEVEYENHNQTENIESLFRIIFDNFIIQKHAFTYLYEFSDSKDNGTFKLGIPLNIYNTAFRKSDINTLRNFKKIYNDVENIKDFNLKNRIRTSLGWFNKTINAKHSERFIYFWIAIESLCMPNTSDIKPLILLLQKAYNLSDVNFFCIGRLYGLRCDIFHNGMSPRLRHEFLGFCESLYIYTLFQILEYDCENFASNYLNQWNDFNLPQYLKELGVKSRKTK